MSREDLVYWPLGVAVRTICRVMGWSVEVFGSQHLPRAGPALIVTNHVSHLDPLLIGLAALGRGRRLAFLAKRELFTSPWTGWLMRAAGQIEVDRGGLARAAVTPAVEALRAGAALVVFPEGTISTSFVAGVPHLGAAKIALASAQPIVPGAVWGGQRLFTKDRRALGTRDVLGVVRFGDPIAPLPGEDPRHLTARAWDRVASLVDEVSRWYPVLPAGPDDRWWLPAHLGGSAPTVAVALARARQEAERRRLTHAGQQGPRAA